MVSVIAFLSVTNIAVGYGLAVYISKNYGTLLVTRGTTRGLVIQNSVTAQQVVEVTGESPSLPLTADGMILEEEVSKSAEEELLGGAATTSDEELLASDTVDEENVLAGIEAFRSQLAKMNEPGESKSDPSMVEEFEEELVGAAG
jgi:hypothetical protein